MLEIVGTFLGSKHWDKRADCAVESPNSPRGRQGHFNILGNLGRSPVYLTFRHIAEPRKTTQWAKNRHMGTSKNGHSDWVVRVSCTMA